MNLIRKILFWLIIIITSIYFYLQILDLIRLTTPYINNFIQKKGNYKKIEGSYFHNHIAKLIKENVPQNSKITTSFSPQDYSLETMALKYALYPLEAPLILQNNSFNNSNDWDYFIDFHNSIRNQNKEYQELSLAKNVRIFSKPNKNFITLNQQEKPYPFIPILLSFLVTSSSIFLLGYALLNTLGISLKQNDSFWFLTTCYLFGTILLNGTIWIHLITGGGLKPTNILFTWAFTIIFIIFLKNLFNKKPLCPKIIVPKKLPSAANNTSSNNFYSITKITFFILLIIYLLTIISVPVSICDEMTNWILKAKIFFHKNSLDFSYIKNAHNAHNYYPILWPINIATHFSLAQGLYDEIAKWISVIIFLCFIAQIRGLAIIIGIKRKYLWLILAIYLLIFNYWTFFTALPETIMLSFLTGAVTLLLAWLTTTEKDKTLLFLSVLMLFGLSGTKIEGAILSMFCFMSLWIINDKKWPWKKTLLLLTLFASTGLIALGWIAYIKQSGTPINIFHLQNSFSLENLSIILNMAFRFIVSPKIMIPLFLSLCFIMLRNFHSPFLGSQEKFLLSMIILLMFFSFFAGLRWPTEDIKLYYYEVLLRLLLRTSPFLMIIWANRIFNQKA